MSHINAQKREPIRLRIDISAEDAYQLQLIQAEYLAKQEPMDLQTIVVEIVHKFFGDRDLAQQEKKHDYHL